LGRWVGKANAPGHASYAFSKLSGLYDALDRSYKLGVSLPDAPLEVFRKLTGNLSRCTEAERLTAERIFGAAARRDGTVIVSDVCRGSDQERRAS
jgi:hypothetical protein